MKSLVTLQLAVLQDVGQYFATDVTRDAREIASRVAHEGESFLTITLPTFGKSLEQGLAEGRWPAQGFLGFKKVRGLPAFMRGFLSRVFADDGTILDEPDADAIWAVRQVCYLTAKVERPCTPEREMKAYRSFIQTDHKLASHFRQGIDPDVWSSFAARFRWLFGDVLDKIETKVASFDLIPRFGPGATAERKSRKERWDFEEWPERLDSVFPSWRYSSNLPAWKPDSVIPLGDERPVRVVQVPKTQTTPRIIAIEPSVMQFAQQALKEELYRHINDDPFLNAILGFTDQSRNQEMARLGSLDGSLATLDLSEASDRLHLSVVLTAFKSWPHILDFILACRSRTADVNGEIVHLNKFASMGSALTFPIETMVFTTIALMGIEQRSTIRPTKKNLPGNLSVYGDDIVVPTSTVAGVIDYLEIFGFKVNRRKSFWTGLFRESCGEEYYAGTNVSVIRLRAEVPTSRQDAALLRRFNKFRGRALMAGLWTCVKACDETIDRLIDIPPRFVLDEEHAPSDVLSRTTFLQPRWRASFDVNLHNWVEKFPRVVGTSASGEPDGEAGLLKWFLENHRAGLHQPDPYESQERAHTFRIKWAKAIRLI